MKRDEIIGGITLLMFGGLPPSSRSKCLSVPPVGWTGVVPLDPGNLSHDLIRCLPFEHFPEAMQGIGKKQFDERTHGSARNLVLFLGTMALATLFFNSLGYPLISFLLLAALLRILGLRRWTVNILLSVVTAGVSYLLFVEWLKIPFPKGLSESEEDSP